MNAVTKEEALQYDLERLKGLVQKREQNIAVFEQAIRDEREQLERERIMIVFLEAEAK